MDDQPNRPTPGPEGEPSTPEREPSAPPPDIIPPPPEAGPPPAIPGGDVPPPPPEALAPSGPSRRSRRGALIVVVVAGLLLVGSAAGAAFLMMRGSSEQLTAIVPADIDVFATAYLDPSAGQKVNLFRMLKQFPDLGEGDELRDAVDDTLDDALADIGLEHGDVEPWLGSQVGVSVDIADDRSPHVAVLVATTDEDASRDALAKVRDHQGGSWLDTTYDGVTIVTSDDGESYAVVDGVVVLGSETTSVKRVIDAAHGITPALATSQRFLDTAAGLPEGKLGLAFVNVAGLVEQFGSTEAFSAAAGAGGLGDLEAVEALGMSVSAEPEGIAVDVTTLRDPSQLTDEERRRLAEPAHENTTLAFAPADAFAVFSQEHIDAGLRDFVASLRDQQPDAANAADDLGVTDAIEALTGDMVLEVRPGTDGPVGGAFVLGTDDARTMQELLDTLGLLYAQETAKQEAISALYEGGSGGETPKDFARYYARLEREAGRIRREGVPVPPPETQEYEGVTITSFPSRDLRSVGVEPAYGVLDGAAVIATSPGEIHALIDAQASGDDVRSSPVYAAAAAAVPSAESFSFLDVQAIATTVRENLPPDLQEGFDRDVAPNLEPITAFAQGGDSTLDRDSFRLVLLIRQEE